MKTTFLAIGLLGAALATTAVFADDANTSSAAANPAMSNQAVQAPTDTNVAPAVSAPQSGNDQVTQQ